MELLIAFVVAMILMGTYAAKRSRVNRVWPVLLISVFMSLAYLSQSAL